MAGFLIVFAAEDGEEREERWPSLERFRLWAELQCPGPGHGPARGRRFAFTAYQEDEDGDWVVVEKGVIG